LFRNETCALKDCKKHVSLTAHCFVICFACLLRHAQMYINHINEPMVRALRNEQRQAYIAIDKSSCQSNDCNFICMYCTCKTHIRP